MKAIDSGVYKVGNPEFVVKRREAYRNVMDALAFKKGVTVDELLVELQPKFDRKFKKDWS